jgi:hypothetical protein
MQLNVVQYGTGRKDGVIPAAGTYTITVPFEAIGQEEISYIAMQAFLDFVGAGGTSIDAFLQTSIDNGAKWRDVMNLQVLAADVEKADAINKYIAATLVSAASDGALAANTKVNGLFGNKWRVKLIIVGAYAADNFYTLDLHIQKLRS